MKLYTEREMIRRVAEKWAYQYANNDRTRWQERVVGALPRGEVYAKLQALDVETAMPEDVRAIIGTDWTTPPTCHECGGAGPTVELGEPPDYESSTANVCRPCLERALALFPRETVRTIDVRPGEVVWIGQWYRRGAADVRFRDFLTWDNEFGVTLRQVEVRYLRQSQEWRVDVDQDRSDHETEDKAMVAAERRAVERWGAP